MILLTICSRAVSESDVALAVDVLGLCVVSEQDVALRGDGAAKMNTVFSGDSPRH